MKTKDTARIVGPETARMLELGHPWVVADAYTRKWPAGSPGQSVELSDGQGRFLATALLDPEDRIVARVLDRGRIQLDRPWLTKRLRRAIELRRHHADLSDTTAYRLVNAEGDGLPGLTVDRYADYLMLQLYSAAWRPHLKLVTQILQELLSRSEFTKKAARRRPVNWRRSATARITGAFWPEKLLRCVWKSGKTGSPFW